MEIKVNQLTKRFGNSTAVDNLSFKVEQGEVLGFLGPNGAGKSTTMKMISGFIKPDVGNVEIDGINVAQDPIATKSRLGYLPEGIPLYSDMPVHSFLAFVGRVRGLRGDTLVNRIRAVSADVQIQNVLTNRISTLSKGYKRRVGLAQALLHDPGALVLDEPTDGLDPNQKEQVRKLIENISHDKAIILSTHILDEVKSICTRVVIINHGKIVVDETPDNLAKVSHQHNSVCLEIYRRNPDEVVEQLQSMDAVSNVQYIENKNSFRISSSSGQSIVNDVWQIADSNGWKIRTLSEEKGDLEDVFRQLTQNK